jgi:hypothetical protein
MKRPNHKSTCQTLIQIQALQAKYKQLSVFRTLPEMLERQVNLVEILIYFAQDFRLPQVFKVSLLISIRWIYFGSDIHL